MIDYIYYRMYLSYQKADDSPHFSATLYVGVSVACLFWPLCIILGELLNGGDHFLQVCIYVLYFMGALCWAVIRYWRIIKIDDLLDYYSDCNANKVIPSWCIFSSC